MISDRSSDMASEINRITGFIHEAVKNYGFTGTVIGISGGIDSAVAGKLLSEALGRHRLFGLLLPERDSASLNGSSARNPAPTLPRALPMSSHSAWILNGLTAS